MREEALGAGPGAETVAEDVNRYCAAGVFSPTLQFPSLPT